MINFNKPIKIFLNKEECEFDGKLSFYFHPTNFSSITLNNVIFKKWRNYPDCVEKINWVDDFSICEIYQENELVFLGIVTDLGKITLNKNNIRTFSVIVTDFKQILNYAKPINKIYRKINPQDFVINYVTELNIPRLKTGKLSFAKSTRIEAYDTTGKSPYSILKDVVERQTGSQMYFTFNNGIVELNYKNLKDISNDISDIELDLTQNEIIKFLKISNLELEAETTDYYNYLEYSTDNAVSTILTVEEQLAMSSNTIQLKSIPALIEINPPFTFIKNNKTGKTRRAIFKEKDDAIIRDYDFIYDLNSSTLEVKTPSADDFLKISYYGKEKLILKSFNAQEISRVSKLMGTDGIVFKAEQYNDINNGTDLLNAITSDLNKYSKNRKNIKVTFDYPHWNLLEAVRVKGINNQIDGVYIVKEITGQSNVNKQSQTDYDYTLTTSANLNTIVNKFDNQAYRSKPAALKDAIIDIVEAVNFNLILYVSVIEKDINNISTNYTPPKLQGKLQIPLSIKGAKYNTIGIKNDI